MHAVVVTWGQVHGGKQAIVERRGIGVAAQQFGGGKTLPFGLEDAALHNRAALADMAIGGHQQRLRVGICLLYTSRCV